MLNTLFTKYAIPTIIVLVVACLLLCAALAGLAFYTFVNISSSIVTTTTTSSSSSLDGPVPIAGAATVEGDKVTLDLKNKKVTFKYNKAVLGEAAAQVFNEPCGKDMPRYAAVDFPNSDLRLDFNACGLGGVAEVIVGKFTVKAKSGEKFTIAYSNCVAVKEAYTNLDDYQRDLQTIGKTCRSYALSSYYTSKNFSVNFMFETTTDKVEQTNAQIKAIVQSMVIKAN
jgi:hypothetical protein